MHTCIYKNIHLFLSIFNMCLLKTHNWFTAGWLAGPFWIFPSVVSLYAGEMGCFSQVLLFFLARLSSLCVPGVWFVQVISLICVVDIRVPLALRCKNTVAITACPLCCPYLSAPVKYSQLWVQLSESRQGASLLPYWDHTPRSSACSSPECNL